MGDLPLRTPTDRRLGEPLPHQQANQTHPHPSPLNLSSYSDAIVWPHTVLDQFSLDYSVVKGRLDTRYSPVRRSPSSVASNRHAAPRLACVKPVASVHPEPGSNSPLYKYHIHFCHDSEIKVNFHFARCSKNCKISFDRLLYPFVVCFQDATENVFFKNWTVVLPKPSTLYNNVEVCSCTTSLSM